MANQENGSHAGSSSDLSVHPASIGQDSRVLNLLPNGERSFKSALDDPGAAKDLLGNMEMPWANSRAFVAEMAAMAAIASFTGAFSWVYMKVVGNTTEKWLAAVGKYNFPDDPESIKLAAGAPLWIPLCWAGGTVVGLLKVMVGLDVAPSFLEELQTQHVDPPTAAKVLVCCVATLCMGASMGPEAGLASAGGAFATLLSNIFCAGAWVPPEQVEARRRLFTLVGIAAAFGSILPAPWVGILLCVEISNRKADDEGKQMLTFGRYTLFQLGFAASLAFVVRYAIEPIKPVPLPGMLLDLEYDQWMPLKALALGASSGVIAIIYFGIAGICKGIFSLIGKAIERRIGTRARIVCLASLAGLLTGTIGFFVPLALTDGNIAITPTLRNASRGALSTNALIATAIGKAFAYWVASSGGLVGGIFFPLIYIGLVVGELAAKIPGLGYAPAAAFTVPVFMASVPCAIIPMPFTLTAMMMSLFHLGPLWCVPIFVGQLAAYTCLGGTGVMRRLMERSANRARSSGSART